MDRNQVDYLLKKLEQILKNDSDAQLMTKKLTGDLWVCRLQNDIRVIYTKTSNAFLILRIGRHSDVYQ